MATEKWLPPAPLRQIYFACHLFISESSINASCDKVLSHAPKPDVGSFVADGPSSSCCCCSHLFFRLRPFPSASCPDGWMDGLVDGWLGQRGVRRWISDACCWLPRLFLPERPLADARGIPRPKLVPNNNHSQVIGTAGMWRNEINSSVYVCTCVCRSCMCV